jgi:hypothetical protein
MTPEFEGTKMVHALDLEIAVTFPPTHTHAWPVQKVTELVKYGANESSLVTCNSVAV